MKLAGCLVPCSALTRVLKTALNVCSCGHPFHSHRELKQRCRSQFRNLRRNLRITSTSIYGSLEGVMSKPPNDDKESSIFDIIKNVIQPS